MWKKKKTLLWNNSMWHCNIQSNDSKFWRFFNCKMWCLTQENPLNNFSLDIRLISRWLSWLSHCSILWDVKEPKTFYFLGPHFLVLFHNSHSNSCFGHIWDYPCMKLYNLRNQKPQIKRGSKVSLKQKDFSFDLKCCLTLRCFLWN